MTPDPTLADLGYTITKGMQMTKYDVCRQFSDGFCAALRPEFRDDSKSDHWKAGFDAGYGLRAEKNRLLNEYLVSTGREPMAVVRLCDEGATP